MKNCFSNSQSIWVFHYRKTFEYNNNESRGGMLSAKNVAEYFLYKASLEEEAELITPLKLQKLLYYAQGFFLAIYSKPLFHERVEKWKHGPVVPEVYHLYKENGGNAIPSPLKIDLTIFDDKTIELLDEVYRVYGQFSAFALKNLTHQEPPWLTTEYSCEIKHEKMKDYFKTQIIQE